MTGTVWRQFAVLRQDRDGWRAEARVEAEPAENDDGSDAYTSTEAEAWDACRRGLLAMATECIKEAGECSRKWRRATHHGVA
jgi:hypothetical protein